MLTLRGALAWGRCTAGVDVLLRGCGQEGVHRPPAGSGEAVLAGGVPVATLTLRPCLMARACLCPAQPSSQSTPMPPVHELAMRGRHSQWAVDGPTPPAPTEPARLGFWSVVGLEPGSHFLEDGLVVVIQGNALIHHLPANGHPLVTGVQMLWKQR